MGFLTRDEILNRDDSKRERVDVPEWGGSIYVRTMTGSQRDYAETAFEKDRRKFRGYVAAMTVCDENGELLFKETDITALSQKSASALDRVLETAARLNGMTKAAVEELEKNSESSPSAGSGSV